MARKEAKPAPSDPSAEPVTIDVGEIAGRVASVRPGRMLTGRAGAAVITGEASAMNLNDAINGLQTSINALNYTIQRIDDLNEMRYKTLKAEMENASTKLDAKASQASLDDVARKMASLASLESVDEIKGDMKATRASVDAILEHLKR